MHVGGGLVGCGEPLREQGVRQVQVARDQRPAVGAGASLQRVPVAPQYGQRPLSSPEMRQNLQNRVPKRKVSEKCPDERIASLS